MIALLDISSDIAVAEAEIGCECEQLLTPLTRRTRQRPKAKFAIDNGAFGDEGFESSGFESLLNRELPARSLCRFVAVPDVVGNARRTLEAFAFWQYKLGAWPLALVAQDGLEDLDIPWNSIAAIFIGGSTAWKLSKAAADVVRTACIVGKWVHAGRVNTPARFEYFEEIGADSIDGTGLSQYSWMRTRIYEKAIQPDLFG